MVLHLTRPSIALQKTIPQNAQNIRVPSSYKKQRALRKTSVLGIGGMGTVYLAEQQHPPREVAVKQANHKFSSAKEIIFQEAMIAGALEHPAIVPIYEVRPSGADGPEIVMRRIKGQTFSELIHQEIGQEDWLKRAIDICISICRAIEYVHSKRILHRDIKPENIMLGGFGEVYLVDWGLAVPMDEAQHMAKGVCGSLPYMAPEMLLA